MLKYSAVILSAILLQIDLIYGQPQAVIDSIEMSLSVEQGNARPSTFFGLRSQSKIYAQELVILINEQIIRHQRNLNLLSGAVLLLAVAIVVFFLINYRKNKALSDVLDKKVTERTKELEDGRNDRMARLLQQELKLQRFASAIGEKINTLKGLCSVAREELSGPVAQVYVNEIDNTSIEIAGMLRGLGHKG